MYSDCFEHEYQRGRYQQRNCRDNDSLTFFFSTYKKGLARHLVDGVFKWLHIWTGGLLWDGHLSLRKAGRNEENALLQAVRSRQNNSSLLLVRWDGRRCSECLCYVAFASDPALVEWGIYPNVIDTRYDVCWWWHDWMHSWIQVSRPQSWFFEMMIDGLMLPLKPLGLRHYTSYL